MKNRFQSLPFKFQLAALHRGVVQGGRTGHAHHRQAAGHVRRDAHAVGVLPPRRVERLKWPVKNL
jgi:hypothetical protein